jgi:phosphoenolpyruvate carboxylase
MALPEIPGQAHSGLPPELLGELSEEERTLVIVELQVYSHTFQRWTSEVKFLRKNLQFAYSTCLQNYINQNIRCLCFM